MHPTLVLSSNFSFLMYTLISDLICFYKKALTWLEWFLYVEQLYTHSCVSICLSSIFDMRYLSIWIYRISRIFKERERFHIKNREQTDNQQTHRCKKLKLLPTPTKDSWGILFITLLVQNYGLFFDFRKKTNSNSIFGQKWLS